MPLTMTVRLERRCATSTPAFTLKGGADFQRGHASGNLGSLRVSVLRADGWELPRNGEHRYPGCAAAARERGPWLARHAWKLLSENLPWAAVIQEFDQLLPGLHWIAASVTSLLLRHYEEVPIGTPDLSAAARERPTYTGAIGRKSGRPRQTSAA